MPNFDTVLLNKQNWCKSKYDIWVLQHKFHHARWKQKQPFTFWYCVDNFYPWKDIVGKKVLRSIAEPKAFYGTIYLFTQGKGRGGEELTSVVDQHHLMRIRIQLIPVMQIRILIFIWCWSGSRFLFDADANPDLDPTFHPYADPDPDPDPSFQIKAQTLETVLK